MVPLMLHRPIIAHFIMLAAPVINPMPIFTPFRLHARPSSTITKNIKRKVKLGPEAIKQQILGCCVVVAQVIAVFGAVTNSVLNSIELDTRTVISWRCKLVGMALIWNSLGCPVHWMAVLGFYDIWLPGLLDPPNESENAVAPRRSTSTRFRQFLEFTFNLARKVSHPLVPSLFRPQAAFVDQLGNPRIISELSFWIASVLSIVHYCYGFAVLSSVMLIGTYDASLVMARYAFSAGLRRAVLLFELDCIMDHEGDASLT